MTAIEPTASRGQVNTVLSLIGLTLPVFAATLCTSALLLFSVQPMFTKMVLPLLGGSPGVWSVAMVFFQAMLLAGYAYAHGLTRLFDPRIAVGIHLTVFGLALFTLPLALASGFGKPPADGEAFWLIGLFADSIGLPFFAVAANAPMLQAWFARTSHPKAADPYFLYGASNLGSFLALLAYPIAIEPMLTLRAQSLAWTSGFVLLMAMIAGSGFLMAMTMRSRAQADRTLAVALPHKRDRLVWMSLAFVPSAMLVAVTSHISTDIASAPFLWVVPLAIFLATFIFTFRQSGDAIHRWMIRLQPFIVAPLVIGLFGGERAFWLVVLVLDLAMLAVTAMICHRELYLRRPDAGLLTGFYLWISVGGVLGGAFAGLVAPHVFPDVWEYPILIVLALLCRPGAFAAGFRPWLKSVAILAAVLGLALLPHALGAKIPSDAQAVWMIGLVGLAAYIMLNAANTMRVTFATMLILVITAIYQPGVVRTETARSFFGVHKVTESVDGRFRMLFHGTTLHGVQKLRHEDGTLVQGRPEPVSYYHPRSPLAQVVASTRAQRGRLGSVAVVGLGTGSLVCHGLPGEHWRYFEIDPVVVRIARDSQKFRYLSDCNREGQIVLGDARLTLADETERFDLIVLDAFSSDVVPVHLLTREALALYISRLKEGGVIAFHISNRYLELASVVVEGAASHGLVSLVKRDQAVSDEDHKRRMYAPPLVAVVARSQGDLVRLVADDSWQSPPTGYITPWTDDYSNILAALWRLHRKQ